MKNHIPFHFSIDKIKFSNIRHSNPHISTKINSKNIMNFLYKVLNELTWFFKIQYIKLGQKINTSHNTKSVTYKKRNHAKHAFPARTEPNIHHVIVKINFP